MTFLRLAACLVLPTLAVVRSNRPFWWLVIAACTGLSLLGFVLIATDKSRARRGRRRIPEATLHLVELLGGWPGSYLAQQSYRHKTAKRSYRAVFWAIVVLHQVLAVAALAGWTMN
ncbi:MAG: DUF1294 domain-containing protein [Acidobacteriota bacterium]